MAEQEQLTHASLLARYEQSALHRCLDLDKLMPLIVDRGILKAKRGEKIQQSKDITLFLALLKKKKVETFVTFLECLQQTFGYSENHRFLVNCMSSELLTIKAPPEAQGTIRAIVEAAAAKTQSDTHESTRAKEKTQLEIQQQETLIPLQPGTHDSTHSTRIEQQREQETLTSKLEEASLQPQQSDTHDSTQATRKEEKFAPPKGHVEPCRSECFTGNIGLFYCPSHGVTIDIPEGAVLPDYRGKFMISMYAYVNFVSSSFEVPNGVEPCTAILLLRVYPCQEFLKPVKLRVPHCAVIEDEDVEFYFLQASEPANSTSAYRFTDELEAKCAEDGYHMETEVNHFSAFLGCRRRSSTRQQRSRRSNSKKSPARQRRLRNSIERTTPSLVKKTSSTASDSSSLERSGSPDVSQESTKVKEVRTHSRCKERTPLTRQNALNSQDTNMGEGQLSTESNKSLYHLCMAKLSHQHSGDSWKETFIVGCSYPSKSLALLQSIGSSDLNEQSFVAVADYLEFKPEKWSECGWKVEATKTPILDIHQLSPLGAEDLRLSYWVTCRREQNPGHLSCRVEVDGGNVYGKPLYFQITSPPPPPLLSSPLSPSPGFVSAYHSGQRRLYTWTGLYSQKSHIITALKSGTESSIHLSTQSEDHRKLLADISYQLTSSDLHNLCSPLGLSRTDFDRIKTSRPGDLSEYLYLMFVNWIEKSFGGSFGQLLSIFSEFGISGIGVNSNYNCDLVNMCFRVDAQEVRDDRPRSCDSAREEQSPSFVLGLSSKIVHCWRFVARFLGMTEGDIASIDYDKNEPVSEKAFQVLHRWMQLKGKEATYGVLLRALYRVYEHDPHSLCDAWNFTKSQLL